MNERKKCLEEVEKRRGKLISLSNFIHQNPELGLKEFKAVKQITGMLREEGFIIEKNLGDIPTAFKGSKKNGSGPRIAFIAEYDALPNIGHACGHNLISTMSVGAALSLSVFLDSFNGEISVIGTPAEETVGCKIDLVKKGVFDNIDVAMMIHPYNRTALDPIILALDALEFVFHGRSAHAAAAPYKGVNALDAIILLFNSINALRQQLKEDVRIHGIIVEGGEAPNIIPSRCSARFYIRSRDRKYLDTVVEKVKKCGEAASIATGARMEITNFEQSFDNMKTNKTLIEIFKNQLEELGIALEENPFLGSTDMGNLSQRIPCIHPLLKVTKGEEGLHTKEFAELAGKKYAQERAIIGAKLLALTGLTILKNPGIVKDIKREFNES